LQIQFTTQQLASQRLFVIRVTLLCINFSNKLLTFAIFHQTIGLKDIALNINMDMVGSPNFFRGIYNGREAPDGIRNQSNAITALFEQFFTGKDLAYEMTPFDGRSDYGPFIEVRLTYNLMHKLFVISRKKLRVVAYCYCHNMTNIYFVCFFLCF
jgi:hypothetical protein